ncbi:MAG: hypothetical protein OEM63_08055 [Gammaproteobacteria bacterium]|nr:hypothetical protein [Gammaproteobacteria bacterium]
MNNEVNDVDTGSDDDEFDNFADDEMAETVTLPESEFTDNVGDASVEINVEELIAEIEQSHDAEAARKKEVRRRLEELAEEGSLEDTYAVDFDKS